MGCNGVWERWWVKRGGDCIHTRRRQSLKLVLQLVIEISQCSHLISAIDSLRTSR